MHKTGGTCPHFQAFSDFKFFLLPRRVHAGPIAIKANC
jgi:hypothetical protein